MAGKSLDGVRAWSFLTVTDAERQHGGNDGYDDRPEAHYSWDSAVPNSRGPAAGDICALRDSRGVLGVSRIERVVSRPGVEKLRRRCPVCGSTAFKPRSTLRPRYRCACRNEFDSPREEPITVTVFRAYYAAGWTAVDGALTAGEVEPAYYAHARQHAIRELDPQLLRALLATVRVTVGGLTVPAGVAGPAGAPAGGLRAASVLQRVGQDAFRRRLIERFGLRCLISGPQPAESLHAAHLYSYAGRPRHDPAGGILLRADLHSLFDAGRLSIGSDLVVSLAPVLSAYPDLWRFDGITAAFDPDDPLLWKTREYLRSRNDERPTPPGRTPLAA